MTRIAIVEDEAAVREQLAGYVQRYTRQYGTPFEVTEFADGMEILENYRPQFDIIFLDVEMKHLDGMETARRIRERDGGVLIVFITNMAQYAIKGYAVQALDYILKRHAAAGRGGNLLPGKRRPQGTFLLRKRRFCGAGHPEKL